jgi:hypothetical protein
MIERMLVSLAYLFPRLFPLVTRADVLNAIWDTGGLGEFDSLGTHFDFIVDHIEANKRAVCRSFLDTIVHIRMTEMQKDGRISFRDGEWEVER